MADINGANTNSCTGRMMNGLSDLRHSKVTSITKFLNADGKPIGKYTTENAVQVAFAAQWIADQIGGGLKGPEKDCPIKLDEEVTTKFVNDFYNEYKGFLDIAGLKTNVILEDYITFGANVVMYSPDAIALESQHVGVYSKSNQVYKNILRLLTNKKEKTHCMWTKVGDIEPWATGGTAFCALQSLNRANCEATMRCVPGDASETRRAIITAQGINHDIIMSHGFTLPIIAGGMATPGFNANCHGNQSPLTLGQSTANATVWINTNGRAYKAAGDSSAQGCGLAADVPRCCGIIGESSPRLKTCGGFAKETGRTNYGHLDTWVSLVENNAPLDDGRGGLANDRLDRFFYKLCCNADGNLDPGVVNTIGNERGSIPNNYAVKAISTTGFAEIFQYLQAEDLQALETWSGENIVVPGYGPRYLEVDARKNKVAYTQNYLTNLAAGDAGALRARGEFAMLAFEFAAGRAKSNIGYEYVHTCGAPHYFLIPDRRVDLDGNANNFNGNYKWDRLSYRTGNTHAHLKAACAVIMQENLNEQNMDPTYSCIRNAEKQAQNYFKDLIEQDKRFEESGIFVDDNGVIAVPALIAPRILSARIYVYRALIDNQGEVLTESETFLPLFIQFTKTRAYIWAKHGDKPLISPMANCGNCGGEPPANIGSVHSGKNNEDILDEFWQYPIKVSTVLDQEGIKPGRRWYAPDGKTLFERFCLSGTIRDVVGSFGIVEDARGNSNPTLRVCVNSCGNMQQYDSAAPNCSDLLVNPNKRAPISEKVLYNPRGCDGVGQPREASKAYGPPFARMPMIMAMPVLEFKVIMGLGSDVPKCQPIGLDADTYILKYERGTSNPSGIPTGGSEVATEYRVMKFEDLYHSHSVCHMLAEENRTINTYGVDESGGRNASNCTNFQKMYGPKEGGLAQCQQDIKDGKFVTRPYMNIEQSISGVKNDIERMHLNQVAPAINEIMGKVVEELNKTDTTLAPLDTKDLDEGELASCQEDLLIALVPLESENNADLLPNALFRNRVLQNKK